MKVQKSIRRVDGTEDHRHRLPGGEFTGGMLAKPASTTYGMHTHLYEFEEDTCETGPMHDTPGHTHSTKLGESSASVPMQKKPGEPWQKMDSLQKEGADYVVRSETGAVIGRGKTLAEAVKHCDGADEILSRYRQMSDS